MLQRVFTIPGHGRPTVGLHSTSIPGGESPKKGYFAGPRSTLRLGKLNWDTPFRRPKRVLCFAWKQHGSGPESSVRHMELRMLLRPRLRPGVPDLVFGFLIVGLLMAGRSRFLNDPGTFWHVRLGRDIIQTRAVPRVDTLTYTRDGVAWVDQSWVFDVGLAAIVDHWGWSGVVAATALILATVYTALVRNLLDDGVSPVIAIIVTVLAVGISSTHFLARPHLFTLLFVLWTARACQRQHERGGWKVAVVPILMIPWANIHGGFLAGPIIVATAAVGHAISGAWDAERKRNVGRFLIALLLACLTPLINPYGIRLYEHVAHLLVSSGVTELIDEYQPLPFGTGRARVAEVVILALIALPTFTRARLSRYDVVQVIVWLHFALGSIRHAPLFAIMAAPGLARLLDELPLAAREFARSRTAWSPWSALPALAVVAGVFLGIPFGRLDPQKWPLDTLPALNRQPVEARLFHEQDWGGLIEEVCQPPRRTFVDDRFELFGKTMILDYVAALHGGPDWDTLRDRQEFALAWVRPDRGLARRLARDPGWHEVHRDAVSVLFRRKAPGE